MAEDGRVAEKNSRHNKRGQKNEREVKDGHGWLFEAEALEAEGSGEQSAGEGVGEAQQSDAVPEEKASPGDLSRREELPDNGSAEADEDVKVATLKGEQAGHLPGAEEREQGELHEDADRMDQDAPLEVEAAEEASADGQDAKDDEGDQRQKDGA